MKALHRLPILVAALGLGGCTTTTVIRPAEWPEGVELLVAPPASAPLAVIEIDEAGGLVGGGTIKGCREDMAKSAKALGATAMYVSSETRTQAISLELFPSNEVTCRAFAYASASRDVVQPVAVPTPPPAPAPPTKPHR